MSKEFLTTDRRFLKKNSHWNIDTYLTEDATKAKLSQLLGGDETPAFLFTASHGIGFPNQDPRQLPHQGAFVCQDWPGPDFREPMPEDFYFSADDVGEDANVFGLISFHFACFGAGTPEMDEFGHRRNDWQQIAPYSFMANLPQRLLSHPKGGALAFVGHVDRAWGYSFGGKEEQLTTFKSTLQRLTEGNRIGRAVECFNERYAAVSSELTKDLWYIKAGKKSNDYQLSYLWTTNNDARGYGIIGDPAVRLMVDENAPKLKKRPEIQSVEFVSSEVNPPEPVTTVQKETASVEFSIPQLNSTPDLDNKPEDALLGFVNLLNNLVKRVEQLEEQVKQR